MVLPPFQTEQYSDFTDAAAKAAYELALAGVSERLGNHAPLVIGSDHLTTGEPIVSIESSAQRRPRRPATSTGRSMLRGMRFVSGLARPRTSALPSCTVSAT